MLTCFSCCHVHSTFVGKYIISEQPQHLVTSQKNSHDMLIWTSASVDHQPGVYSFITSDYSGDLDFLLSVENRQCRQSEIYFNFHTGLYFSDESQLNTESEWRYKNNKYDRLHKFWHVCVSGSTGAVVRQSSDEGVQSTAEKFTVQTLA